MKTSWNNDPAFRVAFVALVAGSLLLLVWQCRRNAADPSRIEWPDGTPAKTEVPPKS